MRARPNAASTDITMDTVTVTAVIIAEFMKKLRKSGIMNRSMKFCSVGWWTIHGLPVCEEISADDFRLVITM